GGGGILPRPAACGIVARDERPLRDALARRGRPRGPRDRARPGADRARRQAPRGGFARASARMARRAKRPRPGAAEDPRGPGARGARRARFGRTREAGRAGLLELVDVSVEREDPLAGLRRAVLLDVSFTVRP